MIRKLLFSLLIVCCSSYMWAQSVHIIESEGWLETAFLKWTPVEGADSYNVYYSGEGISGKQIDGQLIRNYGDYYRADVLGLKAGSYILEVAPVVGEQEGEKSATGTLIVEAHDRSGYAHSSNSPKGSASGAYNDDGTLKSGAEVIYVTPLNAKELDIYTNVLKPREKKDNPLNPVAIRFIGTFKSTDMPGLNSNDLLQLKGRDASYEQQVTLEGVGDDTYLEFGLDIVKSSNVEIRNLGFKFFKEDAVSVQSNNTNVWIHNNDFFYGQNRGGDKKKGDGATDIKDSQWCTISYNHYWDSGKANLFGNSDDAIDYISYHHNFLDHSDSRHPRVRCAQRMHVYNNYYCGVGKYGIGAARQSSIFVECNYFEKSKYPMLSSMQGSDILDGSGGTFSGEDGGIIKAWNNTFVDLKGNYRKWEASGEQNTEFDVYEVADRTDIVPATVKAKKGGSSYSNFDQDLGYNEFKLDTPEQAKINVQKYAGRVKGGDMKITFAADDYLKTDDPDPAITSMLNNYVCKIVGFGDDNGNSGEDGGDGQIPEDGYQFIPDKSINTNNYFTASTSTSSNGGTQTFGDITLAKGLKIDSNGYVTFTTQTDNALMIVGMIGKEDASSLKLLLDGADTGLIGTIGKVFTEKEITLAAPGTYRIEKDQKESYIYYVVVKEEQVDPPSGIEDINNTELLIYPNPVVNTLHISSQAVINSIEIYSLTGTLVQNVKGNIPNLDVSGLSAGSYIVKIQTTEGVSGRMIMKK